MSIERTLVLLKPDAIERCHMGEIITRFEKAGLKIVAMKMVWVDEEFAKNLVTWADVIRKTFYDGGVDEVISTRRLDHIVKAFAIFKDKMKSIELCVARFDDETKESFLDLYTKIDAGIPLAEEEIPEVIEQPQF